MGCKRYFVVVPTAQTTLGGSDLAGHDAPGARAGFALHARPAARQGRGHVLGRKVDGGLRAAAVHPHHDTPRAEEAVPLAGEEERVAEDDRVEAAVGEGQPRAVAEAPYPSVGWQGPTTGRGAARGTGATPGTK